MSVSTIYQTQNKKKKSFALLYVLIFIGLMAVVYFGVGFVRSYLSLGGKATLITDLFFGEGGTYLNGELLGPIPFQSEDIKAGENTVALKGSGVEYEVTLDFMTNSEVVIKRDLGISQVFSGGQNFWLEKNESGTVLSVISEPNGADVLIDGTKVGKTPYSSNDLTDGAYDLRVELSGYEPQTARIEISDKYNLNTSISLFPVPLPSPVDLLEDSSKLYDVYSDNVLVTSDSQAWVNALIYWNKTRGINLAGAGVNKELVFDFFLDSSGNLYNQNGTKVALDSADFIESAERGAYLRKVSDGPGLSESAKEAYASLGAAVVGTKKATVLETGVGWLRVRDEPGLDGQELTKVNVGESYEVLEESSGWVKIKISDGVEGWVSDTYVSIE